MTNRVCHRLERRGFFGTLMPLLLFATLSCVVACLFTNAAPAAVTYAHMMFDDEFRNMWKDGSWRAEVDAKHTTRVYNGVCSMEVTLKGKGALCFSFKRGKDLTRFYALIGWIHGGSEGGQNIRVVLTDTAGKILPSSRGVRLATAAHIQGGEIAPRRWQFFVVPLSQLKPGYKDTTRVALYNPSEETMPTFYLDDVGFTTQRVPLFSKAEKTRDERPVHRTVRTAHVIYTDGLKNGWQDWSWNSTLEFANQDDPARGKRAILVQQKPGGGLGFGRHDAFLTDGYRALDFYVNGGQPGGQALSVSLFDDNDQIISTVLVNNRKYVSGGAISGSRWQQVSIPFSDFRVGQTAVSKIAIINVGSAATTYYIDTVSLVK